MTYIPVIDAQIDTVRVILSHLWRHRQLVCWSPRISKLRSLVSCTTIVANDFLKILHASISHWKCWCVIIFRREDLLTADSAEFRPGSFGVGEAAGVIGLSIVTHINRMTGILIPRQLPPQYAVPRSFDQDLTLGVGEVHYDGILFFWSSCFVKVWPFTFCLLKIWGDHVGRNVVRDVSRQLRIQAALSSGLLRLLDWVIVISFICKIRCFMSTNDRSI